MQLLPASIYAAGRRATMLLSQPATLLPLTERAFMTDFALFLLSMMQIALNLWHTLHFSLGAVSLFSS